MPGQSLSWRHFLLALVAVAIWGTNFPIMRMALQEMPPLLFATLRFLFALLPAAFFIKRPQVPQRELAAYGLLIGVGQFGVLYIAVASQIPPGLASLLMQLQVFFTIGLSIWINKERVRGLQWLALALAVGGIGIIAAHTDSTTTVLGLALVFFAALSWAGGNMIAKRSGQVNMLGYVVWSSLYAILPLFGLSLLFEGWPQIHQSLTTASAFTWAAVLWQSVGNTLFGFGAWAWLLARYPAATVSPISLLVPIFGMTTATLWLNEPLPGWKLAAAALVILGLAFNMLAPHLRLPRAQTN